MKHCNQVDIIIATQVLNVNWWICVYLFIFPHANKLVGCAKKIEHSIIILQYFQFPYPLWQKHYKTLCESTSNTFCIANSLSNSLADTPSSLGTVNMDNYIIHVQIHTWIIHFNFHFVRRSPMVGQY